MISLLNPSMLSYPVLDFGAGSGWITEAIAKMGLSVTAFDIHEDIEDCLNGRISADARIEPSLISTATGDGHDMPFADNSFGLIYSAMTPFTTCMITTKSFANSTAS
jgi:ubiquinone/menaquinone biosynthesis C-methylase UbiE